MVETPNEHRDIPLSPAALLVGGLLAFVVCCMGGRILSRHNPYKWFVRFHQYLNPQTQFYPTASQLCALARTRLDRDKVAVIVGGNSILHGVGQRAAEVWTGTLQETLGEDYRVLNLAVPGAEPCEFGGVLAEALTAEYKRLIYVTALGSSTNPQEPDGRAYRYLYWDAHYKGLLPRDLEREQRLAARRQQEGPAFDELRAGRRLDARLFYQDLWTTLALKKGGTVWTPLLRNSSFRPRLALYDPNRRMPALANFSTTREQSELRIVSQQVAIFAGHLAQRRNSPSTERRCGRDRKTRR